jgi:hypothetical protein
MSVAFVALLADIHPLFYVLFVSCGDAIRLYSARINEVGGY